MKSNLNLRCCGASINAAVIQRRDSGVLDKHTGFSRLLKYGEKERRTAFQERETAKMKLWNGLI